MLFSGIRVISFSDDFSQAKVRVRKNVLNKNFESSVFGGSLFSSADPFFNLLYWQQLIRRGIKAKSYLKGAEIEYLKPVYDELHWSFRIDKTDIEDAIEALTENGRFERKHSIQGLNKDGEACVNFEALVHLSLIERN